MSVAVVLAAGACALAAPAAQASWSIAPGTVPTNTSGLAGVTCTIASSCLVVGFQSGVSSYSLMALWNGSAFSAQTPASASSELYDTNCSPTLCWAVGTDFAPTVPTPHAESYNGTSWSNSSMATLTGSTFSQTLGVACPTSSACFATGWYDNGSTNLPFVELWNGTSWSIQSLSLPANTTAAKLVDISCTSGSNCVAVGYVEVLGQPRKTLILTWNGTAWTTQTSANPSGATGAQLGGVECASSSLCTAVGQYNDSSSVPHSLAEGWNGTAWSVQTVPDPSGGTDPQLNDVSCVTSPSYKCEAVGSYTSSTPNSEPMAAGLSGTTWTLQSVPKDTGVTDAILAGVSCPSTCMADGVAVYSATGQRPTVVLGP